MKIPSFLLATCLVFMLGCQQQIEETQPIRKDLTETVFGSGELRAEDSYTLTALSDGYLLELNFEEGDMVAKGATLAVIENESSALNTKGNRDLYAIAQQNTRSSAPGLRQAQANIDIARQQLQQDSVQAARYEKLWQQNSVARVEYEKIQLTYRTSEKNLASAVEAYNRAKVEADQQLINSRTNYQVSSESLDQVETKAVVAGKVYKKFKEVGDYVRRGEALATIGHPTDIYAHISLDESVISKVKVGQKAVVQLNTHPEAPFDAEVHKILPMFDEQDQSFSCELRFTDPLDFKVLGTQLQTNIIVGEVENALVIPREYLDFNGMVQIKGEEQKTLLATKTISNDWVHVLEGIDEQTTLVVALD